MVKIRVHIFVSGRVQGVFFRQSTQLQAQSQKRLWLDKKFARWAGRRSF